MNTLSYIPEILKSNYFVRVRKNSKAPIDKGWPTLRLDYHVINDWVERGNNYGILCGVGGLLVVESDVDEFREQLSLFPRTFTVKSPKRSVHKYLYCHDWDGSSNIVRNGVHCGECRYFGNQIIGPGSVHPDGGIYEVIDDSLIEEVSSKEVIALLGNFELSRKEKKIIECRSSNNLSVSISNVIKDLRLDSIGNQLIGSHPVHGSSSGKNFVVNLDKNCWYCFRHEVGGGFVSLIAIREGLIKCEEAQSGKISKDMYKHVLDIAKNKYCIAIPEQGKWIYGNNGRLSNKVSNIMQIINDSPELQVFGLNQHAQDINFIKSPIFNEGRKVGDVPNDNDEVALKQYLITNFKFEPSLSNIHEAIIASSLDNQFNPIKSYLENLKWDGEKRLDTWLNKVAGVEINEYSQAVGVKVLCAAVARIFEPGIKFDHLMILEGKQGIRKSTLIAILGGDWYHTTTLSSDDKDIVCSLMGKWIVEIEEMVCIKRQDVERLKAFISRTNDRERLPYRRNAENHPRQSIFIGTLNPDGNNDYLRDQTGNRRFWPIEVKQTIDTEWLKMNRDQLFAEAVVRWKNGELLYFTDSKVIDIALQEQLRRQQIDPWTEDICRIIEHKKVISLRDILNSLSIDIDKTEHRHAIRIGQIMKFLGWYGRQEGKGKTKVYYREADCK